LARRETDGEGGLAVTLRLRTELAWGDGVPVTAHDVAFTWKRATDRSSAFFDPRTRLNVRHVDILDDRTVVLHLSKPVYGYNQWGRLLPEHIEAASGGAGGNERQRSAYAETPTNHGLYDGPYAVTEYRSGERIVLERNPYWHGPASPIRRIVIRSIENIAVLQANLLSRDVDMTAENVGFTVDQVLALRRQSPERFTYLFRPSLGYEHIINLNLANPILADVRVRHALLLAIDRNAINTKLFEGLQPVAATWVNPRLVEDTPENYPQAEVASRLKGVRKGLPCRTSAAGLLLASTMIPTEANGYTGGNATGFANSAMDADIAGLETELDPERQKRIAADMQRIYAEQLPTLPLLFRAEAAVVPTWLHGYALTGHSSYSSRWAEFWHTD
jgi:ABC-type transport system substrate-binding protein